MTERAEIEAVARALLPVGVGSWDEQSDLQRSHLLRQGEAAIAALDRLRDARGDEACNCYSRAFKDPMQHAPTCPARSPQREDQV